jgi:S1-C subfamily serine protease
VSGNPRPSDQLPYVDRRSRFDSKLEPCVTPLELYEKYSSAVAYIAVRKSGGAQSIGTAFHVGDGVFLTAKHVVENREILEIATTVPVRHAARRGIIRLGPYFHPESGVDVAAIIVDGIDAPAIPLGSHLDDWLNDEAFILSHVVAMGYPTVPLSQKPVLIVSHGEVNAVVDPYTGRHPHFVVSATARGGFSGGPCLIEHDFALGMITQAFLQGEQPIETGYMAVLTVEPLFVCMQHHGILPAVQKEGWDGLWD